MGGDHLFQIVVCLLDALWEFLRLADYYCDIITDLCNLDVLVFITCHYLKLILESKKDGKNETKKYKRHITIKDTRRINKDEGVLVFAYSQQHAQGRYAWQFVISKFRNCKLPCVANAGR